MMQSIELTEQQVEVFWSKVNKTDTCWLWEATLNPSGYGMKRFGPQMLQAHRISYVLAKGSIPVGMQIDHTCHVRACVNPAHLRTVTHKQNMENVLGAQKNSKSGVRGVTWDKQRELWRASVCHNRKQMNLGNYKTIEEATTVAKAKRLELFTHNDADR